MADLTLTRTFPAPAEKVFKFVTRQEHLKDWLGPVGMKCTEIDMNFAQDEPWFAVILSSEGQRHKMSGVVTAYDAPNYVEFTWGWHDDDDLRGAESNVRFQVDASGEGSVFSIIHTNLPDEESAQNHEGGWTSTLTKLEALLA